jgi:hypothetical protein
MLRALDFILRVGFAGDSFIQDDPNRQGYLKSKLNAALGRYGLEVVTPVKPTPTPDASVDPRSRFKIVK